MKFSCGCRFCLGFGADAVCEGRCCSLGTPRIRSPDLFQLRSLFRREMLLFVVQAHSYQIRKYYYGRLWKPPIPYVPEIRFQNCFLKIFSWFSGNSQVAPTYNLVFSSSFSFRNCRRASGWTFYAGTGRILLCWPNTCCDLLTLNRSSNSWFFWGTSRRIGCGSNEHSSYFGILLSIRQIKFPRKPCVPRLSHWLTHFDRK